MSCNHPDGTFLTESIITPGSWIQKRFERFLRLIVVYAKGSVAIDFTNIFFLIRFPGLLTVLTARI